VEGAKFPASTMQNSTKGAKVIGETTAPDEPLKGKRGGKVPSPAEKNGGAERWQSLLGGKTLTNSGPRKWGVRGA